MPMTDMDHARAIADFTDSRFGESAISRQLAVEVPAVYRLVRRLRLTYHFNFQAWLVPEPGLTRCL